MAIGYSSPKGINIWSRACSAMLTHPASQKPPWGLCRGQLHGSSCSGLMGILGGMTCHIHPYTIGTHHYSYRASLHATESDATLHYQDSEKFQRGVTPPGSTRILDAKLSPSDLPESERILIYNQRDLTEKSLAKSQPKTKKKIRQTKNGEFRSWIWLRTTQ